MKVFDESVTIWTKDIQFILDTLQKLNDTNTSDQLYGKLDFSKIATLGQSVGGAVAGQACYIDNRIKAGVNLDCFQFGDLCGQEMKKPFMLLQSDTYPLWAIDNKVIYAKTTPFHWFKLENTRHFIFSDCCLFPAESNKKMKELIGPGISINNIHLINEYLLEFYNHYLNQLPFTSNRFNKNF